MHHVTVHHGRPGGRPVRQVAWTPGDAPSTSHRSSFPPACTMVRTVSTVVAMVAAVVAGAGAMVKGPCSGSVDGGRRVCADPTTFCDTFENRSVTDITGGKLKLA